MDIEDDDFDVDDEPKNVKSSKKSNQDNSKTVCKIYLFIYFFFLNEK
jgi:hypothetical protein